MTEDNKLFDGLTQAEWVDELARHDAHNERHLLALFAWFDRISVQTMLDVGSGTGAMVNMARRIGVEAYGVDQIQRPEDYFFVHDLREPFSLASHNKPAVVDLVLSLEVAEHLPPEKDDVFCDTCAGHVKQGGYLIFTSAHPGQGGSQHKGIRPAPHWREKFHWRGLTYDYWLSLQIAHMWHVIQSPLYWLISNVQVFKR